MDSLSADAGSARNVVRSCTTCSKAKAKCVRQAGEDICERCARLKKECISKEPVLRRRKPVKTTRAAQLEQLENKIEHLVNALSNGPVAAAHRPSEYGQPSPPTSHIPPASTDKRTACDFTRSHQTLGSLCAEGELLMTHAQNSEGNTPATATSAEKCNTSVRLSEAEILLDRYQRLMAAGLPFVALPQGTTASSLAASKPVLLRAICTVAMFNDLPRQQALVKDLIQDISQRIMVNGEKTVDLLAAILVFVAWYHPHVFWSFQVTNLLHLAIAMITDLGMDRNPSATVDFKSKYVKAVHGASLAARVPSLEERRILQGVFYLTSMLSSSFKKIDAIPYTTYMEATLTHIEEAREYDSDLFLVQIVRVQRLIEAIHTTESPNAPARIYIRAFQADIERLRRIDPCKEDNVFLQMQYLTAEIVMWELSLNDLQDKKANVSLSNHIQDLYNCVSSIKRFLDIYFTIPSSAYLLLPFSIFGQFAHAFIVLTKLASLEVDGWDLKALDDQLSFASVIEECATRFDEAAQGTPEGMVLNNDSFTKWAQRVKFMKQVYEQKFTTDGSNAALAQEVDKARQWAPMPAGQPTPPDDPVLSADFFNYLDDNFWQSFAGFTGDWELQLPELNGT